MSLIIIKVIPLKKKQILEFSITWHGDTLRYGVSKNALKAEQGITALIFALHCFEIMVF